MGKARGRERVCGKFGGRGANIFFVSGPKFPLRKAFAENERSMICQALKGNHLGKNHSECRDTHSVGLIWAY